RAEGGVAAGGARLRLIGVLPALQRLTHHAHSVVGRDRADDAHDAAPRADRALDLDEVVTGDGGHRLRVAAETGAVRVPRRVGQLQELEPGHAARIVRADLQAGKELAAHSLDVRLGERRLAQ